MVSETGAVYGASPIPTLEVPERHTHGEGQFTIDSLRIALAVAKPEGYVRTHVIKGEPMRLLIFER